MSYMRVVSMINIFTEVKMKSKSKKLLTVDFVVLILPVFNGCYVKGCPVWKNEPIWFLLKVRGNIFRCMTNIYISSILV